MAQTGYTPILIYSSSTASQAPAVGNLTNSTLGSELAINITDGKLFYKDNANAIQVIGWKTVPTTAGGTGLTSYTAGDLLFYASGTALSKLAIGASTTVLTSSGSAPQWTAQSALAVGQAANLKSNATTGVMQITGPATGTTRVMTIPNANFTAARTDAGQTFTGAQIINGPYDSNTPSTSSVPVLKINEGGAISIWASASAYSYAWMQAIQDDGTNNLKDFVLQPLGGNVAIGNGNLVIGTSGKGIDFSATPGTGTSELLADYEEGTWTPTDASGAGLTFTTSGTNYTKIGNTVFITGVITWPSTSNVSTAQIGGLPFTSKAASAGFFSGVTTAGLSLLGNVPNSATTFFIAQDSTTNNQTNAALSTRLFAFSGTYLAS